MGIQMVVNTANFESDGTTETDGTDTRDLASGKTFALTFTSKLNETFTTIPIVFDFSSGGFMDMVKDVEFALESLPNKVIDDVHVEGQMARVDTNTEAGSTMAPNRILSPALTLTATQCISTSLSPARTY